MTDHEPPLLDPAAETVELARRIRQALTQLGLAWESRDGGMVEVSFASLAVAPTPDLGPVALLEVDTTRLPRRVSIADLTAERTLRHLGAVCGKKVRVLPGPGLRYAVILEPKPRARLPERVLLSEAGDPPDGPYQVPVGFGEQGPVWRSLPDLDCILVAGQRQLGKSSWINAALAWLLAHNGPETLRLALVDPKEVELSHWAAAPHLLGPVAVDAPSAGELLGIVWGELERRRALFARNHARNLTAYNLKVMSGQRAGGRPLPAVLVVVDEVGDLAAESGGARLGPLAILARLIAKGGAFGIRAILATQRPDADAVAGILKANIATRLAFWLPDGVNYRIALAHPAGMKLPRIPHTPGRMIARMADGYQVLQAFHLPDADLERIAGEVAAGQAPAMLPGPLGPAEVEMIAWAVGDNDGGLSIENVQRFLSLSQWQARRLAEEWEARGWLRKDPGAGNLRRVTGSLAELAERFEDDDARFEETGERFEDDASRFEDDAPGLRAV